MSEADHPIRLLSHLDVGEIKRTAHKLNPSAIIPSGTLMGPKGDEEAYVVLAEVSSKGGVISLVENRTATLRAIKTRVSPKEFKRGDEESYCTLDELRSLINSGTLPRHRTTPYPAPKQDHPGRAHIVQYLDFFRVDHVDGDRFYLTVMELLGPSLDAIFEFAPPRTSAEFTLSSAFVKSLARQVLSALDFLHSECGILHLNLNTSNVLLSLPTADEAFDLLSPTRTFLPSFDSDTQVKLCGFQFSQWFEGRIDYHWGPVGNIENSWIYSAPEWNQPMRYMLRRSPALDVWPFGCLIFDLLAGESLINVWDDYGLDGGTLYRAMLDATSCPAFPPPGPTTDDAEWFREWGLTGGREISRNRQTTLGARLAARESMPVEEAAGAAAFIERCLKIVPTERASIKELQEHPWLSS